MKEKKIKSNYIYEIGSINNAPSCHASNIIELPNKKLFATWWAGAYEKSPDVAIYGSFLDLNSENSQWSPPRIIVNTPDHFNGTPVSYSSPNGTLFLFYRVMHHGKIIPAGHTVTTIKYIASEDFGNTWSKPKYLRRLWGYVIRGKSLKLPTGRVILPFHREFLSYQSRFFLNDDPNLNGKWYVRGKLNVPGGCLEPSITFCENNSIICSLRTFKAKFIYFSYSNDYGLNWSTPKKSKIPNPNSQTDIISLRNGHLLLVCNPLNKGRNKLSIIRSHDYGKSWDLTNQYIIEIDKKIDSKFSYPCIIQTNDDKIHVSYTFFRKTIKHIKFKEFEIFD